jgi:hypothetical protein
LNNVLLPTLFTLVNNIEQYCWAWIGCNNIVQYCWQLWTMWAAKHCSILFSSILHEPERFYACSWDRACSSLVWYGYNAVFISVCSDYNHVRTWNVTRFRGMLSTQPGSAPLASFKVVSLERSEPHPSSTSGNMLGE